MYLITDLDIGGAEKSLYQLVSNLNRKEFTPVVISLTEKGQIGRRIEEEGVEVLSLQAKSRFDPSFVLRLLRILKRKRPHILHSYLFHANFIGRIAGKFCGIPIIISSVRTQEKEQWHHLYLNMFTQWMADRQICVSREVEKFVQRRAKVPACKLLTIHNGLDLKDFDFLKNKSSEAKKKELSLTQFNSVVGTVGHLTEAKGIMYLLKAFSLVLKDAPRSCLLIVGEGKLRELLSELADRLKISAQVKFLGLREDALEIMRVMDIFVLSSLWEGFPNVILEAQALGKPVVTTWVGGCREIIKDGENGFLVPPGDPWSLYQSIKILLEKPSLRETFGQRGRELVKKKFTLRRMVSSTENLYRRLLAEKRMIGK